MKRAYFAEFYIRRGDGYDNALGSDSVYYLDGRWSLANMKAKAAYICKQRSFDGYRIARGTHTQPFYLTAGVLPV